MYSFLNWLLLFFFVSDKHAAIVSDEACKNRILQLVDPTAFTPEFHLDCRNLCANFHEDIQFRFSLSLGTLFQRLSAPRRSTNSVSFLSVYSYFVN